MRFPPALLALIIILPLVGCDDGAPEHRITQERVATTPSKPFKADVSSKERLGVADFGRPRPRDEGAPSAGLDYTLPPGWNDVGPARMRLINLETGSGAECYVSHAGGGVLPNVNRWLNQMGEAPLGAQALEELPTLQVLGKDAVYIERAGSFQGKPDHMLVGVLLPYVLSGRPGLLTVKMVGAASAVKGEVEKFQALCGSLKPKDPHAGHDHGDAENPHGGTGAGPVSPHGPAGPPKPLKLAWTAPRGWNEEAPRPMREVTFTVGESECYVSALRGAGGGVEANVKRWRGQLGVDVPLNLNGLPRVPMLGRSGIVVRAEGTYTDMEGATHADHALLGAICKIEGMTVFVKMIGPKAEVDGQHEAFMGFCESLKRAAQ